MKPLIIYYSMTGNNAFLAKDLKERMEADIQEIREKSKRGITKTIADLALKKKPSLEIVDIDIKAHDFLLFVAPIWADGVALPMKAYLEMVSGKVERYAFASLCLGTPDVEAKLKVQLPTLLNREPQSILLLKINDLLPDKQKNSIKASLTYRIQPEDYKKYERSVEAFTKKLVTV